MPKFVFLLWLILLLPMQSCILQRQPDFDLIYHDLANIKEGRTPLVGIHGLMGSTIVDPETGKVIWGHMVGFFSRTADMRLALPIDQGQETHLVATSSIKEIGGVEVYGGIVKTLIDDAGYTAVVGPGDVPQAPFFPFAYDWRLSNVENAGRLATFITSIRERLHDPSLKVDIVAHSLGGLIARYYLLYGDQNVLGETSITPNFAGARHVRKLAMLGTPNMGSVSALLGLIDGWRVGLVDIPPDLVATMPSMIELMPAPSETVFYTTAGKPVRLDIYDVDTWRHQRWGIFDPNQEPGMIKRYRQRIKGATQGDAQAYMRRLRDRFRVELSQAKAFHQALKAGPIPASTETLLLGGDCTPTLQGLVVEREGGVWVVRRDPAEVKNPAPGIDLRRIFFSAGDGEVTKTSLLAETSANGIGETHTDLPFAQSGFICAKHVDLVKNWTFRDNLLNFLLQQR